MYKKKEGVQSPCSETFSYNTHEEALMNVDIPAPVGKKGPQGITSELVKFAEVSTNYRKTTIDIRSESGRSLGDESERERTPENI